MEQVDVIRRFIDKYPDTFEFVTSVDGSILWFILDTFSNFRIDSKVYSDIVNA